MPGNLNTRMQKKPHLTHSRAVELAAEGVRQGVHEVGKDKLAKAGDCSVRVIEKWMAEGSLPDIDYLLNMADAAPEVLRALLSEKGWILTPALSDPANDMTLAAGLGHSLAEWIERLRDGKRCHVDTDVMAGLFRELIPQMQAVVDEADARRAA